MYPRRRLPLSVIIGSDEQIHTKACEPPNTSQCVVDRGRDMGLVHGKKKIDARRSNSCNKLPKVVPKVGAKGDVPRPSKHAKAPTQGAVKTGGGRVRNEQPVVTKSKEPRQSEVIEVKSPTPRGLNNAEISDVTNHSYEYLHQTCYLT